MWVLTNCNNDNSKEASSTAAAAAVTAQWWWWYFSGICSKGERERIYTTVTVFKNP